MTTRPGGGLVIALLLFACASYDHRLVQQIRCQDDRWTLSVWTLDDAESVVMTAEDGTVAELESVDPFPGLSTCAAGSGFTDRARQPIRQGWFERTNLLCDDETWLSQPSVDVAWTDGATSRTWTVNCDPIGFTGDTAE